MNNMQRVEAAEIFQTQAAMQKYNGLYSNKFYLAATAEKTTEYANALIDEAMALCGHPRFKLSNRRWSDAALAFLAEFTE
jgi:hypothetical protein